MNSKDLYNAIGDIDEKFIEDADKARRGPAARVVPFEPACRPPAGRAGTSRPWLTWAMPIAACLVLAVAISVPTIISNQRSVGGDHDTRPPSAADNGGSPAAGAGNGGGVPTLGAGNASAGGTGGHVGGSPVLGSQTGQVAQPSLKLDEPESAACYADPTNWRGLPASDYVLQEKGVAADRMAFTSLQDLADYSDAWVLIAAVREVSAEGDNMQTAIAEYAQAIGDVITTRQWDDYTISTGSRILIRQTLIGGCLMREPNNLLRKGGVYLLPVKFDAGLGAYSVTGDLDVLFELDDAGAIHSHSRYDGLNQYDGKSLPVLLDAVRALYPAPDAPFTEQPITSAEQAEEQLRAAYIHGLGDFPKSSQ